MAQQEGSGSLLAMIVDADTATGLLLTGVGQVDLRKRANFLIVDDSERDKGGMPEAAGITLQGSARGSACRPPPAPPLASQTSAFHSPAHSAETSQAKIEETFKEFTNREDIAVLLINQVSGGCGLTRANCDWGCRTHPRLPAAPTKHSFCHDCHALYVLFSSRSTYHQHLCPLAQQVTAPHHLPACPLAAGPWQVIAGMIRHLLDGYNKPVPAILEIPSKDAPYDPSQDSVLQRVRFMFGES